MDDPVLAYFSQNLATVSKEELLQALKNALESANYWRDACLLVRPCLQSPIKGGVHTELESRNAKQDPPFHTGAKGK